MVKLRNKLGIVTEDVMEVQFSGYRIVVDNEKRVSLNGFALTEIQLAGGTRPMVNNNFAVGTSEAITLRYVSHEQTKDRLIITERNENIEVVTAFSAYEGTDAVAVEKSIKNISCVPITIESASTLTLPLGMNIDNADKTYFYKFVQSHHSECQVRKFSLFDFGFFRSYARNFKKLSFANIGSWSTKEELPQGIIEDGLTSKFVMFEIESNHNWYYELSTVGEEFYLSLIGNSSSAHRYARVLSQGETYTCARVAIASGSTLNETIGNMTKYRRYIAGKSAEDRDLPVIFNEYMHLSWDEPCEKKTRGYAPMVAAAGAKYYIIDCGWHDDMEDGVWVYPYMGRWKESKKNFPEGIRATTDYIRSLGLKAGLWIEPEIIGDKCAEMLEYYDEDCFLHRNGARIHVGNKYILDFRAKKVRDYLTETIRRMVEDYGADYIKMDYNVDSGFVDGDFEEERKTYLKWADEMQTRFNGVLFETCSSGGMRMDYETLKHFSIVSTSDQIRDLMYPYIVGNVLSAVLPEQAAVWSYPVSAPCIGGEVDPNTVTCEKVVLNMVNAFLGRMHLASDLSKLSADKFNLVREGVEYSEKLAEIKRKASPYFPLGFTDFSAQTVSCGLKADENGREKLYLAVWVLRDNKTAKIPLTGAKSVALGYPNSVPTKFALSGDMLTVEFPESNSARIFEIEL